MQNYFPSADADPAHFLDDPFADRQNANGPIEKVKTCSISTLAGEVCLKSAIKPGKKERMRMKSGIRRENRWTSTHQIGSLRDRSI